MTDHEYALDSAKWIKENISKNAEFIHAGTLRVLARGLISADTRIAELEAALDKALPLDRLMGQLASALMSKENHGFIEPFLKTGLNVIARAKDALAKGK